MTHSDSFEELQAEQRHLREEVDLLKKQVNMLMGWFVEQDALSVPAQRERLEREGLPHRASWLLSHLPHRFTVDDLITLAEETGVDVLRAYQDLQLLMSVGYIEQTDETYEKTSLGQ